MFPMTHITFNCAEGRKSGVVVRVMSPGHWLVRDDSPLPGQPDTRFVFEAQLVK